MRSDFMRPDFMQASRAYPDLLLATGVLPTGPWYRDPIAFAVTKTILLRRASLRRTLTALGMGLS